MAIIITSGSISFDGQEFKKGDVTASKDFEIKRKSDAGIPLKRLKSFSSASTFIDFNTDRRKGGQRKGQAIDIMVKETYEALHVDPHLVSLGPVEGVPIELTGSLNVRPAMKSRLVVPHKFHGNYSFTGQTAGQMQGAALTESILNVAMTVTGSSEFSGSTVLTGGDTQITGSTFATGSSGSFGYTNLELFGHELSMDIDQGGFFGLAVSGSTAASNNHNMANNLSGFFLTGSNVIISGSAQLSGSTIFEGGDTIVTQSINDVLIVSGGNTVFDVQNVSSSFDITGSDGSSLNVSGGNSVFDVSDMAITGTIILTGSFVSDVSNISSSFEISGSVEITGSTTFDGDAQITGSFIQSGSTIFTGGDTEITGSTTISGSTIITGGDTEITGSTIFSSDSGSLPSGFVSGSEPTGSSEIVVEGDIEVSGSIIENYTNNVPISASMLLTTALHGQGRQLFVRSGSAAIDAASGQGAMPAGLPVGNGIYKSTTPAGNMVITLPSASVGMSFHIINHNSPSNVAPFIGNQYGPSLYIDPSGSQRFAFGANGGAAVAGKAIINHSGSNQTGDFIKVYCISSTAPQWMIFQTGGTWTDEA